MKTVTLKMFGMKKFFCNFRFSSGPGNMGTIIRTADAAGMTGVIVSKDVWMSTIPRF